MVRDFYFKLYCYTLSGSNFPISGGYPHLSYELLLSLNALIFEEEIRRALFSIGGLKAPASDGLHAIFL